jgi:tetratricopeptide (TPR) repeat protein
VIEIRRKILGEDHTLYAQSVNNYSVLLRRLNRHEEAQRMLQDAVAVYRRALGDEHPALASPLLNLSAVLSREGQHEESLNVSREAEAICVKAMGDEHWFTNFVRAQVGWSLFKLERHEEAEAVLLAAHEALVAALPKSAHTDAVREKLVKFFEAREMPERAAEYRKPDSSD